MTVQMTVIGLNQVGVSLGLAVKAANAPITLVGCEPDPQAEQKAQKMGAFEKTVHKLSAAVENADIVVMCLPVDEVHKSLETIAPSLKEGAVVLETSALKTAAFDWAARLLPAERYLLAFTPTLNPIYLNESSHGIENAHADLFVNSAFLIGSNETTDPDAVRLAADLAVLVGARPYFSDPEEAEGLTALVHHLPQISAAALYKAMEGQPGWREARKIGSRLLVDALSALENLDERKEFGQALLLNSQNSIRVIDVLIDQLVEMRDLIASQDRESLKKYFETAIEGRALWLEKRKSSDWESSQMPDITNSQSMSGKLFGLGKKKPSD
jgi:prephenate dehydrogenase